MIPEAAAEDRRVRSRHGYGPTIIPPAMRTSTRWPWVKWVYFGASAGSAIGFVLVMVVMPSASDQFWTGWVALAMVGGLAGFYWGPQGRSLGAKGQRAEGALRLVLATAGGLATGLVVVLTFALGSS